MADGPGPVFSGGEVSSEVKGEVSSEVKGGEVSSEVKGEVSSEVKGGEVSSEVKEVSSEVKGGEVSSSEVKGKEVSNTEVKVQEVSISEVKGREDDSKVKAGKMIKIRAVVRLRPFFRRETEIASSNIMEMAGNRVILNHPAKEENYQFEVDACHWSHDGFTVSEAGVATPDGPNSRFYGQEAVFQDIGLQSLEVAWQGYNTTTIAYGMTGSGKSYTMLGSTSDPGLVYLCSRHLFAKMDKSPQNKYKVTLSLLELYNENVVDLLSKSTKSLKIRHNKTAGVCVTDLTIIAVKNAGQMEELILQGLRNRMIAATKMNSISSRSHLIVTLHFLQFITKNDGTRIKRRSRIRFVDLAGSERSKRTGATGISLREGVLINKSMLSLGSIISILAERAQGKKVFVPYRESKLTVMLMEELGGSCYTTFIGAISPAEHDCDENLTTLRFIHRAGKVTQQVVVNDLDVDTAVKTWKATIAEKEAALSSAESEEAKKELEEMITKHKLCIRHLELPWMEVELKDKSITWWSPSVQLQQPELETSPYIQNISNDSLLSGVTKMVIPQGHTLAGNSSSDKIQLSGLGIQPQHAIFVNTGSALSIAPCSSRGSVHVNGQPVHIPTELKHMDHIKFGACEFFVVVGFPDKRTTGNANNVKNSYDKCLTELAEHHPLAHKLQPSARSNVRAQTAALLLFQEFTELLPEVIKARALATALERNINFEVEAQPDELKAYKFFIKVTDRERDIVQFWTKWKFEDRRLMMDQLYEDFLTTGKLPTLKQRNQVFQDAELQDILLGRGKLSLNNIAHSLPVDDDVSIIDFRGKQAAILHVTIITLASPEGPSAVTSPMFKEPTNLLGSSLHLRCTVPTFSNVHWVAANSQRGIYCKLWTNREKEVLTTGKVWGVTSGQLQDTFQISFKEITPTELILLQSKCLMVELWGMQVASSPSSQTQPTMPVQALASPIQQTPQTSTQDSDDHKMTARQASDMDDHKMTARQASDDHKMTARQASDDHKMTARQASDDHKMTARQASDDHKTTVPASNDPVMTATQDSNDHKTIAMEDSNDYKTTAMEDSNDYKTTTMEDSNDYKTTATQDSNDKTAVTNHWKRTSTKVCSVM